MDWTLSITTAQSVMSGSCWPEWSMGGTDPLLSLYQIGMLTVINDGIQRWVIRWTLGCVNSASFVFVILLRGAMSRNPS